MTRYSFSALAAFSLVLVGLASISHAEEAPASAADLQFAQIASWQGRWKVAETEALEIVFESTARGKTIVERWETGSGLHSITVYHLDGDRVVATHYCPQGNQPRLEAVAGGDDEIAFTFRDVTDLDEGESHTYSLRFKANSDGSLVRTEVYKGAEGIGDPSSYTLVRATKGG
ncbi:hypothetical protein [Altererythrobacter sp. GH1-8]|uniref:hypothetical protein n=1 Tax=Altererythrobacter sp. GH1-8 TaxID=3349333 RepID=UPI00374DF522